ncbi:MAG: hypothetical protein EHM68_15320 [Lysobacterales bacterium]|nr:MAG: hypothetical protein EHM68_15320 [Xanthomonadales bacterium]
MPGDGVSLPTTLAQLGNVAKVQARAASPPQPTTPFAELAEQRGELSARKVQETKETQAQRRLDADQDGLDKRQRRRQRRQGRADGPDEDPDSGQDAVTAEDASPLGHLVDLLA